MWFGAVTYDERAGLSYTTGEVTHHIGSDVDAERDRVVAELTNAGWVGGVQWIDDFHRLGPDGADPQSLKSGRPPACRPRLRRGRRRPVLPLP
ncbi:MAG TPA: LssY C-terminal domain-containing protein, partial [Steroidobacteraceae bacterium]|nr:LssY C-terminal domain-containing protein [Steroidobacteraceae bacterium]